MTSSPFLIESTLSDSRYTNLIACISEEDDGYILEVKLYHRARPESTASGEEIMDSLETASTLVAALAAEFSIAQTCIKIEIRMHKHTDGTRH
jgi:hypothetical protein